MQITINTHTIKGRIKKGYHEAGRAFFILSDAKYHIGGHDWIPILYVDEDDPTFLKSDAIEIDNYILKGD